MKRLLLLVAMLVPLSLFIAGCDSGAPKKAPEPTADQKKQKQEEMQKNMAKMRMGPPVAAPAEPAKGEPAKK